jgi:ATP-dependent DNA ligase
MQPGGKVMPGETAVDPMLAEAAEKVPDDPGVWSYEPKWDGFLH